MHDNDMTSAEQAFRDGFEQSTYGISRADLACLGERSVRYGLNAGKYGVPGDKTYAFVLAWISDVTFTRSEDESSNRSKREAESLSIAKDANAIARNALRWATIAQIIAISAIAITAKDHILSFIFGTP